MARRAEIAERIAEHPRVFEFNRFPSARVLKKVFASALLLEEASEEGAEP